MQPTAQRAPAEQKDPAADRDEFNLEADTEVLLNGLPPRYEEVPSNAVIQRIEVTRDGVIVRVYFRTR